MGKEERRRGKGCFNLWRFYGYRVIDSVVIYVWCKAFKRP
jgi:hypothetical protein